MYIYNVTSNIDESIQDEWLHWMKSKHIPNMLSTQLFSSAKISQVMIQEEMGGVTYAVQYTTDCVETLDTYYKNFDAENQKEIRQLFGEKVLSFSTELQVIAEQFSMSFKN